MSAVLSIAALSGALFIAWLLGVAGWHKLRAADYYGGVMAGYWQRLEPTGPALAWALGLAELAIAAGLLMPHTRPTAAVAAMALLALYLGAMAVQVAQGKRDMDCGCAGPAARHSIRPALLLRNAVLIAVAGLPLLALPASGPAALALAAATALLTIGVYLASEGLLANADKLINLKAKRA